MSEYLESLDKVIKSWDTRIDWEHYFMCAAVMISSRSSCERLHVGCALVKDTRIISVGYNGFLANRPHDSIIRDNHEQATVHAEQNAISDCSKRGISCDGATAYITHYPCIICTRMLIASGIKEIKYINNYNNDELVIYFCEQLNIKIIQI